MNPALGLALRGEFTNPSFQFDVPLDLTIGQLPLFYPLLSLSPGPFCSKNTHASLMITIQVGDGLSEHRHSCSDARLAYEQQE